MLPWGWTYSLVKTPQTHIQAHNIFHNLVNIPWNKTVWLCFHWDSNLLSLLSSATLRTNFTLHKLLLTISLSLCTESICSVAPSLLCHSPHIWPWLYNLKLVQMTRDWLTIACANKGTVSGSRMCPHIQCYQTQICPQIPLEFSISIFSHSLFTSV